MFIEQASRVGLSPEQTETVGREINQTPDRRLTPETRTQLIEQVVKSGASRDEAEREVTRLEVTARLLPTTMTAHGLMTVPPITVAPQVTVQPHITVNTKEDNDPLKSSASMGGSESILGSKG
jgi:hypothetical protein